MLAPGGHLAAGEAVISRYMMGGDAVADAQLHGCQCTAPAHRQPPLTCRQAASGVAPARTQHHSTRMLHLVMATMSRLCSASTSGCRRCWNSCRAASTSDPDSAIACSPWC